MDLVEAVKWLLLAGSLPEWTPVREKFAARLSTPEMRQAERMAEEWREVFHRRRTVH